MTAPRATPSRKVYLTGSRSEIRVPMREIPLSGGNPPVRLYDTSGPYTDPDAQIDLKRGLPPLRLPWIGVGDPKSTRLNSSHSQSSHVVFCLKKKIKKKKRAHKCFVVV